ncbi:MerR family transcriptional regulator, partial [bacterium]|nr:MerR family transcriptional regulator [bacterium]
STPIVQNFTIPNLHNDLNYYNDREEIMFIDKDKPFYNVSQVAEILGITPDRLRTYDEEGLISPYRVQKDKKRLYSQTDIEWLQNCRTLIKKKKIGIYALKVILLLINSLDISEIQQNVVKDSDTISLLINLKENKNFQKIVPKITI